MERNRRNNDLRIPTPAFDYSERSDNTRVAPVIQTPFEVSRNRMIDYEQRKQKAEEERHNAELAEAARKAEQERLQGIRDRAAKKREEQQR